MRLLSWSEYVRLALSYAQYAENDDGSFSVEVPVLPGCVTWGGNRAEAALMAEDAVQGWIVTGLRFGDDIPVIEGNALAYVSDGNSPAGRVHAQA